MPDPFAFILTAGVLLISLSVHEAAHAYAAYLLGDSTAKDLGRLTLNPIAHIDPYGAIALIVLHFGWGKPVPYNPLNLKEPKRDALLIAMAGPASNLALALLFALPYNFFFKITEGFGNIFCGTMIIMNLILMTFNLIPIPPLDGSKIIEAVTPEHYQTQLLYFLEFGPKILLAIVLLGVFTNLNIFSALISPVVNFLWVAINFNT